MNKKLRNNFKKLRKGEANVGLIMLAFGAILAVAMYLYARNAGDGISNTVTSTNAGLGAVNETLGSDANDVIPDGVAGL